MIPKHIIHLLSGGLDSTTLLYDLHGQGHSVHCLLFNYKQRHVQELTFAIGHCRRLGVLWTTVELPELGVVEGSWIVPNRNAVLLSMAVSFAVRAGAETVTIACNADDSDDFPDCRKPFIEAMNQSVKAAELNVEICAPYIDWPKWKIGGLAREIGVPIHELWTCYRGGSKPCGECPACKKLAAALDHK